MFHRPVEELWQGLHVQINLPSAAKRGAQEAEGKTPSGSYKEKEYKWCAQGLHNQHFEEGHILSLAMAFQQTTNDKDKEGSSTSCSLVQSVWLWASWEHNQRAKRRGPQQLSALVGRIWPQVIRSCGITGKKKREEEEKGDYSTSSLLCWASTLRWLQALRKLHPCPSGGFGRGATGTAWQGAHCRHLTRPRKTRESVYYRSKWEERTPQPLTPPVSSPCEEARPQTHPGNWLETPAHQQPCRTCQPASRPTDRSPP